MKTLESIQVLINGFKKQIQFDYSPTTDQALFDICDLNGRVFLSGEIKQPNTFINISDLFSNQYILLILDGTNVISKKFSVR